MSENSRTVLFPSRTDCEAIPLEFVHPDKGSLRQVFLVDSGFTGGSSLVVSAAAAEFAQATVASTQTRGALQGTQGRILLQCNIPSVSFTRKLIAIVTDTSALSLPSGITGLVGLTLLRQFSSWGATVNDQDQWQFFLTRKDS